MTTTPSRIAVVGGGLSGLAAAHRLLELGNSLNHPIELSVFEASARIGGVMGTKRIGEYLVETGWSSFITVALVIVLATVEGDGLENHRRSPVAMWEALV